MSQARTITNRSEVKLPATLGGQLVCSRLKPGMDIGFDGNTRVDADRRGFAFRALATDLCC
jgi:hypothetical protein